MTNNLREPMQDAEGWNRASSAAAGVVRANKQDALEGAHGQRKVMHRTLAMVDRVTGGKSDWVVRFFSYALIGGSAAVVNLICFSLLMYYLPIDFGSDAVAKALRYIVVFVTATEISTLTNFAINDRVTFSKLPGHARSWIVRCLRFHLTTVVGTLLTFAISFTLAHLGVAAILAQAIAIGIAFLLNFTLHHVFTYRHLHTEDAPNLSWTESATASGGTGPIGQMGAPARGGPSSERNQPASSTGPYDARAQAPRQDLSLTLSIIIPAHNEEEALRPTISRLHQTLVDEHIPFEILVINDHSTDSTEAVLRQLLKEFRGVRYVSNEKPGGFGRAIQTGLEHFAGDAVCIVMADASDDPRDVVTYYRKLQQGYECVFGSRFVAGSKVIDYPRHKLLINRLANWFINVLFQLHFNDTTNAFKAYRREVIAGVSPVLAPHFNITVELPLKAITRGYTYATVPINWYNRATGVSKLKIKEMGSRYLFIVLYIWLEKLLSHGDYHRPIVSDADHARQRSLVWAQYETMPHKSVARPTDIADLETARMPIPPSAQTTQYGDFPPPYSSMSYGGSGLVSVQRGGTPAMWEETAPGSVRSSAESSSDKDIREKTYIPSWFAWLTSIAMVSLGLAIYGRSIDILPLSDDWGFLEASHLGPQNVFLFTANYHYNPVAQGIMYAVYLLFGVNPLPYHVVTLTLFSVCVVLILRLGWKLTRSFTIGVLASLLFIMSGRQYEGVVWTLVSIFQVLGLVLYLSGLLFYLHAQGQQGSRRLWMLIGLYVCMVLAVFTYEQEISLIVACMLYRFFVIEYRCSFRWNALLARARVWIREFGFPFVFFAAYLVLKYWLGLKTGRSQVPGLSMPVTVTVPIIVIGLYESFMPGILTGNLLNLQLLLLQSLSVGHPLWARLVSFAKVLMPLGIVIVFAKPVYRWLVLWSILIVASTVMGIGYLAARYQMLFIVPAVIIWAAFLVWLATKLRGLVYAVIDNVFMMDSRLHGGLRRIIPVLAWLPMIAILAVYSGLGLLYTSAQIANWQQASDIEGATIHRIANLSVEHPNARNLYLVNLPDNLPAPADPTGHFEHGAYLFQDGASSMVDLSLPGRFQQIDYLHTPDYHAIGTPRAISRAEVASLNASPGNLVVCFSDQTHEIELWGPLCP